MSAQTILRTVERISIDADRVPGNGDRARAEEVLASYNRRNGLMGTDQELRISDDGMYALELLARGANGAAYAQAHLALASYAQSGHYRLDLNGDRRFERGYTLEIPQSITDPEELAARVNRMRVYLDAVLHFVNENETERAANLRAERAGAPATRLMHSYVSATIEQRNQLGLTAPMSTMSEPEFVALMDALRGQFLRPGEGDPTVLYDRDLYLTDGYGTVDPRDVATARVDPAQLESDGNIERPRFAPRIPGTELPRTPANYVDVLRNARGDEDRVMRLLIGLSDQELTQVAYLYTGRRMPDPVPANADETRRSVVGEFRDSVAGELSGLEEDIARATINNNGFMPQYMRLYMNASGRRSQNGASVHAQLEAMTGPERSEAFRLLESELGVTAEELFNGIRDDEDRRYARFLAEVPITEEGIDRGWIIGYRMMAMAEDFGWRDGLRDVLQSDIRFSELVGLAQQVSPNEMARAATAFDMLRDIDDDDFALPEGVDDSYQLLPHLDVANSQMVTMVTDEAVQRFGIGSRGDEARDEVRGWVTSLMSGLRYDARDVDVPEDGNIEAALLRHNRHIVGNNAEVIARAFGLQERGQIDETTMRAMMAMIDRQYATDERRPINGLPSSAEVVSAAQELQIPLSLEDMVAAAQLALGDRGQQIAAELVLTTEAGAYSPQVAAVRINEALNGEGGPNRALFYEVMDMSGLPPDRRQQFLADVHAIYQGIVGSSDPRALIQDTADAFGRTLSIDGPNGEVRIESRAMTLAQFGSLSVSQRILLGAYENNSLLELMPVRNTEMVLEGLSQVRGASSYFVPYYLAEALGMEYDPEHPEAVYDAIFGRNADGRIQMAVNAALPTHDDALHALTEAQLFYLRGGTDRENALLDERVTDTFGISPEDYQRLFGMDLNLSERGVQLHTRQMVETLFGERSAESFFYSNVMAPDAMAQRNEQVRREIADGPIMRMITNGLGHEYELIKLDLAALTEVSRQAEMEILAAIERGEEPRISDATLDRAVEIQQSLMRNIPNLHELSEERRAAVVNALSAAVMIGGSIAGLSSLSLGIFNSLARIGTTAALGNTNLYDLGAEGVRGGMSVLISDQVGDAMPVWDATGDFQLREFTRSAIEAGLVGGTGAGAYTFVDTVIRPEMHTYGTGPGVMRSLEASTSVIPGAALGSTAFYSAIVLAQELLADHETRDVELDTDEPDPDEPGTEPPDIDGPDSNPDTELPDVDGPDSNPDVQLPDTDGPSSPQPDGTTPTPVLDDSTPTPISDGTVPITDGDAPPSAQPVSEVSGPAAPMPVSEVSGPAAPIPVSEVSGPAAPTPVSDVSGPPAPMPVSEVSGPATAQPVSGISGPSTAQPAALTSPAPAPVVAPPPGRDPALVSTGLVQPHVVNPQLPPMPTAVDTTSTLVESAILDPTSGTAQVDVGIGSTASAAASEPRIGVWDVPGPITDAEAQLLIAGAELLGPFNQYDVIRFRWPVEGFTHATQTAAAGAIGINQPGARAVHLGGTLFGDRQEFFAIAASTNGVLANTLLNDPQRLAALTVDELETTARRFSGLPPGYDTLTSDDERREAILQHIARSGTAATYDYEESYGLGEGWTIDDDSGAVVRSTVQVDGDGQGLTRGDPAAPITAPVRPAEPAPVTVDGLLSDLAAARAPAMEDFATDPEWYQRNFLPLLELMNGLPQGSLTARVEGGEAVPEAEMTRYLSTLTQSAPDVLEDHETQMTSIFGRFPGSPGQDGEVTARDFEVMDEFRALLGTDVTAPTAIRFSARAANFFDLVGNATQVAGGPMTGPTAAITVRDVNDFLRTTKRPDGSGAYFPQAPEGFAFVSQGGIDALGDYLADQEAARRAGVRAGQLRTDVSGAMAAGRYGEAVRHLEAMRVAGLEGDRVAAGAYEAALREASGVLTGDDPNSTADAYASFLQGTDLTQTAVVRDLMVGSDGAGGALRSMGAPAVGELAERLFAGLDGAGDGTLFMLPAEVVGVMADQMPRRSGTAGQFYDNLRDRAVEIASNSAAVEAEFQSNRGDARSETLDLLFGRNQEEQAAETVTRMFDGVESTEERNRLILDIAGRIRRLALSDAGRKRAGRILAELTLHGDAGVQAARQLIELTVFPESERQHAAGISNWPRVNQWDDMIRFMMPGLNPSLRGDWNRKEDLEAGLRSLNTEGDNFLVRLNRAIHGQGLVEYYWDSDSEVHEYLNGLGAGID